MNIYTYYEDAIVVYIIMTHILKRYYSVAINRTNENVLHNSKKKFHFFFDTFLSFCLRIVLKDSESYKLFNIHGKFTIQIRFVYRESQLFSLEMSLIISVKNSTACGFIIFFFYLSLVSWRFLFL